MHRDFLFVTKELRVNENTYILLKHFSSKWLKRQINETFHVSNIFLWFINLYASAKGWNRDSESSSNQQEKTNAVLSIL